MPRPEKRFAAFSEFEQELFKPSNSTLSQVKDLPLIERDPLLAWKLFCLVLLGTNAVAFYLLLRP